MTSVAGAMDDVQRIDYMAPPPVTGPDEAAVVEYRNASLDHYFITAEPAEMAMLDAGAVVPGWQRTGLELQVAPRGIAARDRHVPLLRHAVARLQLAFLQ